MSCDTAKRLTRRVVSMERPELARAKSRLKDKFSLRWHENVEFLPHLDGAQPHLLNPSSSVDHDSLPPTLSPLSALRSPLSAHAHSSKFSCRAGLSTVASGVLFALAVFLLGVIPTSTVFAQEGTITVCVKDYCEGQLLSGVSVRQQYGNYAPRYEVTEDNGCVTFFHRPGDIYTLHLPAVGFGDHHPWRQVQQIQPSLFHSPPGGQTYIEFLVLPIIHIDQLGGTEYAYPNEDYANASERTNYYYPFESCADGTFCVGIREWGNNFLWPKFDEYIDKLEFNFYFETSKFFGGGGSRVAETGFVDYASIAGPACSEPPGPRSIYGVSLDDLRDQLSIGQVFDFGMEYGCLDAPTPNLAFQPYEREHHVRRTEGTPPELVDFMWTVIRSGPLGNNNTSAIPVTSTSASTADRTGFNSVGIEDPNVSGYDPTTGSWGYTLKKVDCESGATLDLLLDVTRHDAITSVPFNFELIEGVLFWFQQPENTLGFCFEFELWVDNGGACDRASRVGWFDPDETCANCLTISTDDQILEIEVWPNPVSTTMHIAGLNPTLPASVYDAVGRRVLTLAPAAAAETVVDVAGFAPGLYRVVQTDSAHVRTASVAIQR